MENSTNFFFFLNPSLRGLILFFIVVLKIYVLDSMMTLNKEECKESCETTDGCKGFVWSLNTCNLMEGSVKVKGDKERSISGILPCP